MERWFLCHRKLTAASWLAGLLSLEHPHMGEVDTLTDGHVGSDWSFSHSKTEAPRAEAERKSIGRREHVPSTSRQRQGQCWRDRDGEKERETERDGKGQGNSERRDCMTPNSCSKIYPLSHLFSGSDAGSCTERWAGSMLLLPQVDIGHSLDQQNVVGVMLTASKGS